MEICVEYLIKMISLFLFAYFYLFGHRGWFGDSWNGWILGGWAVSVPNNNITLRWNAGAVMNLERSQNI